MLYHRDGTRVYDEGELLFKERPDVDKDEAEPTVLTPRKYSYQTF